jgi:hypothetical protein
MIPVYIGFDPREAIAYSVLAHSIHAYATQPVSIAPLMLNQLQGLLTRERHPLQSSDFSFSRFLTPSLSGYSGWSLFMDCDMLMLDDIAKLWAMRDERYAVMVVKHDHVPKEARKFLGEPQTKYEKKNWSSVMLFNNAKCRAWRCINSNGWPTTRSSVNCRIAGITWWGITRSVPMPRWCITHWADRTSASTPTASTQRNGVASATRC